jgi:two-component system, NtrC family, sensor histidine kinase GlrK
MDNLVSNAIKFSPSGGFVRLKVSADQTATRFEVSDQGPGVAAADRSRVFDAFYQGEPPAAASVQGTGLGLSIAREHVLALGGTIDIDENYQGGACFRVMLPNENQVRT